MEATAPSSSDRYSEYVAGPCDCTSSPASDTGRKVEKLTNEEVKVIMHG